MTTQSSAWAEADEDSVLASIGVGTVLVQRSDEEMDDLLGALVLGGKLSADARVPGGLSLCAAMDPAGLVGQREKQRLFAESDVEHGCADTALARMAAVALKVRSPAGAAASRRSARRASTSPMHPRAAQVPVTVVVLTSTGEARCAMVEGYNCAGRVAEVDLAKSINLVCLVRHEDAAPVARRWGVALHTGTTMVTAAATAEGQHAVLPSAGEGERARGGPGARRAVRVLVTVVRACVGERPRSCGERCPAL